METSVLRVGGRVVTWPRWLRCGYRKDHHERDGVHQLQCTLPFWHNRNRGNTIHLLSVRQP